MIRGGPVRVKKTRRTDGMLRRVDCHFRYRAYKLRSGRRHACGDRRPKTIMFEGHDPYLVALSVVIAILGGYTGFGLAARIAGRRA